MKKLLTLIILVMIIGNGKGFGQLSGDYYIPQGSNPQGFATLADAISSINANGCSGNVVFYIDGDLSEIGANLSIYNATLSATNNLTIKPAATKTPTVTFSGCTATAGATQYTGFAISNTSYITIDGSNTLNGVTKDLTFLMNDGTNGRNIIQLYGNCDNVTIKNMNISYKSPMSTANTTRGIYLNGQSTGACDNFTVNNCTIGSQTLTPYYAVSVTGSSGSSIYCTNVSVLNNILYGRIRPVYLYYVGTTGTTSEIKNNIIFTYGGTNATTTYTILFNTWNGTINISNNILPTITTNNTVTNGIYGVSGLTAQTGAICNINNNFIGGELVFSGSGIPTVVSLMYLQDNATYNVYHNTFIYPSVDKGAERSCLHISGSSAIVNLQNNILVNNTDNAAAYTIWKSNGTLSTDYNNLYVSGTNANIGYVGSAAKKTLANWQAAVVGYDVHSVSKSVSFTSSTDLHLVDPSIGDYDLTGTPISGITTDIDGNTRDALFPYMGADENTTYYLHSKTPRTVPMTAAVNNATAFGTKGVLGTDGDATFYAHWDATYLYLGWSGGKTKYSSDMYYAVIDTDPDGSNGTDNTVNGVSFLNGAPNPDFYVVYENNESFYGLPVTNGNAFEIYNVNSGWQFLSRAEGDNGTDSQVDFKDAGGEVRYRIPWSTLNFTPQSGSKIGIVMWNNNASSNYMWGRVPTNNPTNGSTPKTLENMFVFDNTGSGVDVSIDGILTALPVELTSFQANYNENLVTLTWQTATEINSYCFEVERSNDNTTWVKIGSVNAGGNSNKVLNYEYFDNITTDGKYYYRLKQIDLDGSFKYTSVVEVNAVMPMLYSLSQNYPNPFNPTTKINYSIPVNAKVTLNIYSITGELVTTLVDEDLTAGNYTIDFDASRLASGTYFYRIIANDFVQTKKMLLIK